MVYLIFSSKNHFLLRSFEGKTSCPRKASITKSSIMIFTCMIF